MHGWISPELTPGHCHRRSLPLIAGWVREFSGRDGGAAHLVGRGRRPRLGGEARGGQWQRLSRRSGALLCVRGACTANLCNSASQFQSGAATTRQNQKPGFSSKDMRACASSDPSIKVIDKPVSLRPVRLA